MRLIFSMTEVDGLIDSIYIKNFKSIKEQDFQLSPITVLIGANGSGKSSVLQALAVLKGFVEAPNRALDALFDLYYINLGKFKDVVLAHRKNETIKIGLEASKGKNDLQFVVELGSVGCSTTIEWRRPVTVQMQSPITLPFSPAPKRGKFNYGKKELTLVWDGLNAVIEPPAEAKPLSDIVGLHKTEIQKMSILLSRRGFTKPQHQSQKPSIPFTSVINEDQVASLLEDADIEESVMSWTEEVFGVQVRAKPIPPNVTLVTRARQFAPLIVNEGLGLNQATYVFAVLKAAEEGSLVAVEEPEISLHPQAQSKLANIFSEVATLNKRILITTHSEHIVIALLTLIAEGKLSHTDLSIYSFSKAARAHTCKAKKLKINEKGQVAGGIKNFFDHELSVSLDYMKALSKG